MADEFLIPGQQRNTLQDVGLGLQAFSAGFRGQGPQFLAGQQAQEQGLSVERQRAAADDVFRVQQLLGQNDLIGVRDLAESRLSAINQVRGDTTETQQLLSLVNAAIGGDQGSLARLKTDIDEDLQAAVRGGFIKLPEARETFEDVLDEAGNVVAQRNTLTGEVTADPRAKQRIEELKLRPKAVEIFEPVLDEDGLVIGQRSSISGKVISDPRVAAREKRELSEQRKAKVKAGEQEVLDAALIASENIDQTITTIDRLPKHPGLRDAVGVGFGQRFIPGTTSNDFVAIVETVRARLGFDELAKMRAASPTGGALGQVTERELGFLQAANQSLDISQTEKQFLENLDLIKDSLRRLQENQKAGRERDEGPRVINLDAQGNIIDG